MLEERTGSRFRLLISAATKTWIRNWRGSGQVANVQESVS